MILPKICDAMYAGKDSLEILSIFREKLLELPDEFLYTDQIDMKLEELQNLIMYIDNDQPFVQKMREEWSKDIREILIDLLIMFDMSLRRKSIFSTLGKMNRVIGEGKSIDTIHDLMGLELKIYTQSPQDSQETVDMCYQAMNAILMYFANSKRHVNHKFLLCESGPLKDACPLFDKKGNLLSHKDKRKMIKIRNHNLFIPEMSGLLPELKNFCKDYIVRPKLKSFYQGLQASICYIDQNFKRIYFEIQIKTQVMRDELDKKYTEDGQPNPGNHNRFKLWQKITNDENISSQTPQFDLNFKAEKCRHIFGFREDPEKDCSGILAPKVWNICNSTHNA